MCYGAFYSPRCDVLSVCFAFWRPKRQAKPSSDDGYWDCSVCTFKNSAEAFKCMMCDVRKGTSTRWVRHDIWMLTILKSSELPNWTWYLDFYSIARIAVLIASSLCFETQPLAVCVWINNYTVNTMFITSRTNFSNQCHITKPLFW